MKSGFVQSKGLGNIDPDQEQYLDKVMDSNLKLQAQNIQVNTELK